MADLGKLVRRVGAVFTRARRDAELRQEIADHIDLRRQQLVSEGMDARQAASEARRMFGNPTLIRESTRAMWTVRWIETMSQDVRYSLRLVRRSPMFTAIAVLSLALGIASSTVVTGIVNAALWRWSAMYAEPDRLVYLWQTNGTGTITPTPADFRDWREMSKSFERVEAYTYRTVSFTGTGDPEQFRGASVTPTMFETLGVEPIVGSGFAGDEETWGRHTRVLLSEGLWRRRFNGDRAIVGRTLVLNGRPHEVAGVMPAGVWFSASKPEIFLPLAFAPDDPSNNRNSHFIWVVARLRDGVKLEDASAEMAVIARQLEAIHPANKGYSADVALMSEVVFQEPARTLSVLTGAVVLVLVIACANVAGLLLIRTGARQRELAIRSSLGASRARVASQLLVEGLTLAILGGVAGAALAAVSMRSVPALLPSNLPRITETGIPVDWRVLSVSAIAVMTSGLFIGTLPALSIGGKRTTDPLKESGRSMSGGRRQTRLRAALVGSEIALALMLVVGALLLVRSFANVQRTELGVRPADLLTMRLPLGAERFRATNAVTTSAYLDSIVASVRGVPGVLEADITSHVPLGGGGESKHFIVEGEAPPASYAEVPTVSLRQEGPDSLKAMGAQLVAGRLFEEDDRATTTPVAVINQTLARRFFGSRSPIGRLVCLQAPEHLSPPDNVTLAGGSFVRWTVVGVVEDIRYTPPGTPQEAVVYVPYRQRTQRALMGWAPEFLVLHTTPGISVMPAIRERLRSVAPTQPVAEVRSIETLAAEAFGSSRVIALVLVLFSVIALFLSAVGVYGAVASAVSTRSQEIGIRVALGAQPSSVVWLVLRQIALLAVLGLAVGIVGALAGARSIQSQLHGLAASDLASFFFAALMVIAATALAAWVPARRASRIDPVVAMRNP